MADLTSPQQPEGVAADYYNRCKPTLRLAFRGIFIKLVFAIPTIQTFFDARRRYSGAGTAYGKIVIRTLTPIRSPAFLTKARLHHA